MSRRAEYRVSFTFMVPLSVMTAVDAIAESEGVSASAIALRALRAGLAQERDARQAAAQAREKEGTGGN